MLLSDAIRLGSLIRPKIGGYFYRDGQSCAMGAAAEGAGCDITKNLYYVRDFLQRKFRFAAHQMATCPLCNCTTTIWDIVVHLNNNASTFIHGNDGRVHRNHDISREAIADYVEGFEIVLGLREMPSSEKPGVVEVEASELVEV